MDDSLFTSWFQYCFLNRLLIWFMSFYADSVALGQVRLCLDRKDFIRAQILSRKINPKSFTESTRQKKKAKEAESIIEEPAPDVPTLPELRRIYYEHMIRYCLLRLLFITFGFRGSHLAS